MLPAYSGREETRDTAEHLPTYRTKNFPAPDVTVLRLRTPVIDTAERLCLIVKGYHPGDVPKV